MFNHHAPLHLWREVRQLICELWMCFGAPEAIVQQGVLDKLNYGLLSMWLRGCEAVLRALLFIEAVHVCTDLPVLKPHRPRASKARALRAVNPDDPATWRVRFRVFDPAPVKGGARVARPNRRGPNFYYTWPLAIRAEALLRVFNNPAACIRRLARKLKANRRKAQRINTSGATHRRVMSREIWNKVCAAFAQADARLGDSS